MTDTQPDTGGVGGGPSGSASATGNAESDGPTASGASQQRPPLRRLQRGKMIGGVAAGLAEHFAVDVTIVRVVLVLLALLTNGAVVVAYLIALIIVPSEDDLPVSARQADADRSRPTASGRGPVGGIGERDATFWVGIAMLVIAGVLLFSGPLAPSRLFGPWISGQVIAAFALIAFGLALWRVGDRRDVATDVAPPPYQPPAARTMAMNTADNPEASEHPEPAVDNSPVGEPSSSKRPAPLERSADETEPLPVYGPDGGDPPSSEPPASTGGGFTPPPVSATGPSILGRATVGIALVAVGVLWLLDTVGALALSGVQLVAAALFVVGVGLLVSAFVGRARGLIVLGIVLVPIVILAAVLRPFSTIIHPSGVLPEGAGDVRVAPTTAAELTDDYRLAAGRFEIDLSHIDLAEPHQLGTSPRLKIEQGAGELIIVVPHDTTVHLDASIGIGELRVLGQSSGWIGIDRQTTITTGQALHELHLEVSLGVGSVRIEQPNVPRAGNDQSDDRAMSLEMSR